jgi:hypothetical protein
VGQRGECPAGTTLALALNGSSDVFIPVDGVHWVVAPEPSAITIAVVVHGALTIVVLDNSEGVALAWGDWHVVLNSINSIKLGLLIGSPSSKLVEFLSISTHSFDSGLGCLVETESPVEVVLVVDLEVRVVGEVVEELLAVRVALSRYECSKCS